MDFVVRVSPVQKVVFQKPNAPHVPDTVKKKKSERFEDILVKQLEVMSGK